MAAKTIPASEPSFTQVLPPRQQDRRSGTAATPGKAVGCADQADVDRATDVLLRSRVNPADLRATLVTQAAALALVASAIVSWNTQHLNARLDRLRAAGRLIDDEQLARLSPALSAHILINGRYHIPDPRDHLQSAPRDATTTNARG